MSEYNKEIAPLLNSDNFFQSLTNELEKDKKEKNQKGLYTFLSLKQLFEKDFPKENWIVDRIIPEKGLTCIGGLPATMKSYFTNYLAGCIATGLPVLDKFPVKQANVLFIDKENKLSRIKERFSRLGAIPREKVFFLESNFLAEKTADLAAVCAFIKDHNVELTFIDTLVRIHQQAENDATEMNKVFLTLRELQLAGSSVCFIHHFNKKGSGFGQTNDVKELLRGSGDILAMVDNYLALKLDSQSPFIEVEQAKSRDDGLVPRFLMEAVFNKDKTYFHYIKEIEDEERLRRVIVEDEILKILEKGTSTRKGIIAKLSQFASIHTVDRAIKTLKQTEDIISYSNSSGEFIYCLKKTQNSIV